jgi:hypothetical protein
MQTLVSRGYPAAFCCAAPLARHPGWALAQVRRLSIMSDYLSGGPKAPRRKQADAQGGGTSTAAAQQLLPGQLASPPEKSLIPVLPSEERAAEGAEGADGDESDAATTRVVDAAMMAQVVADLQRSGQVAKETSAAIEATEEWRDYDAEITFELLMLRHRYQSEATPMTPARRAQMQAHMRAKQAQIMEQHAERVAKTFVEGLTAADRAQMASSLLRIDAAGMAAAAAAAGRAKPGADSGAGAPPSGVGATVGDQQLKDALWELTKSMAPEAGSRPPAASPGPARTQASAADAARRRPRGGSARAGSSPAGSGGSGGKR